jgi:hypothetical protein
MKMYAEERMKNWLETAIPDPADFEKVYSLYYAVQREEHWEPYECHRSDDRFVVEIEPGNTGIEIVGELERLLFLATIEREYCDGMGIEQWYAAKLGLDGVD